MNARGIKELRNYENGEKLTLKQSILAKCCECMGKYVDGKMDCGISECPLYPFMRYGVLWKGRVKRFLTPERKKLLASGLKKGINGGVR